MLLSGLLKKIAKVLKKAYFGIILSEMFEEERVVGILL